MIFCSLFLPAFIHVADISPNLNKNDRPDEAFTVLVETINTITKGVRVNALSKILADKMAAGLVLLLVDGWDELPANQRPRIAAWLNHLLTQFPESHVIVAAPERGYIDLLKSDFVLSGIMPWRRGQVETTQ